MKRVWLICICLSVLMFPQVILRCHEKNLQQLKETRPKEQFERMHPIRVLHEDKVLLMDLETYVLHVLQGEMPSSFHIEALKAQAVAIRTYTLRSMSKGKKHMFADVCTDSTCCQAYNAIAKDRRTYESAVESTFGQVLTFENDLIEATYFSSSGGRTEAAEDVWGSARPYLQSKASHGEEKSPYHVNQTLLPVDTFLDKLGMELAQGQSCEISVVAYTKGGGVRTLRVCHQIFTGLQLRQKLSLRSTAFTIELLGDTVQITTKGNGHRVGMSQYGANAMAAKGSTYQEILAYYYPGTDLIDG